MYVQIYQLTYVHFPADGERESQHFTVLHHVAIFSRHFLIEDNYYKLQDKVS